ncbi:MAG: HD domain-containing protein [Lentisphaeria bacterium]|nr:HD domain-containing protein [Lentisphaeria bacterium]
MTTDLSFFDRVRRIVQARLAGADGCHDWDHTERVCRNAELLLREFPDADAEVVRLAALLHDVGRPDEKADGRVCHARRGAELTEEILTELRMEPGKIKKTVAAVRTHRYRDDTVPASLEAEIVYDADKLDSLGAVGIGRAFLFAGKFGARLHNTEKEALESAAYSPEDTAYREYLVKLRKLPGAMRTLPGKRLACERVRFMQEFFDRLNAETAAG